MSNQSFWRSQEPGGLIEQKMGAVDSPPIFIKEILVYTVCYIAERGWSGTPSWRVKWGAGTVGNTLEKMF